MGSKVSFKSTIVDNIYVKKSGKIGQGENILILFLRNFEH